MKLSWTYLAGFFDGEGCVSTYHQRARRGTFGTSVTFSQSGVVGRRLLVDIQGFLLAHGIKTYIHEINKRSAKTPMYNLRAMSRPSVMALLGHLQGRVYIKRVIVEDTLRFLKAFPCTRVAVVRNRNNETYAAKRALAEWNHPIEWVS